MNKSLLNKSLFSKSSQSHNKYAAPSVTKAVTVAVIAGIALLGGAAPRVHADTPGAHPRYLHGLNDLRAARAYLTAGNAQNVQQNEGAALVEIDQCLETLRRAAADDGKNLAAKFPVDTDLSHRDRLSRALALLGRARQDINQPESNPAALGLQRDVLSHVSRAYGDTQRAIRDSYHDQHPFMAGTHPHFLHAISDLRMARGLINFPDGGRVAGDERAIARSLTEAIRAAKRGAVDDGLDIFSNPAPAGNLPRHNRLAQAAKLIQDARNEETQFGETNPRTDTTLYSAVAATDRAFLQVRQALRDDAANK